MLERNRTRGPGRGSCPPVRATLTEEEAYAVIEPYFIAVRDVFVSAGAKRARKVRLEVARWVHDSPRHFAATEDTGRIVVVAPEFAELPEDTVRAILSHEFGHATDFLYPGDYVLVDDGELVLQPRPGDRLDDDRAKQAAVARSVRWEHRDKDTVERTADAIAEHFTGMRIGYAGPCELQSFERGKRPRPKGLR